MEAAKNPKRAMVIQIVAGCQFSTPRVIYDDGRTDLGSLHYRFDLAAILHALSRSLCEQEIDGALFIVVAALE